MMEDTLIKQIKHYQRGLLNAKELNNFSEILHCIKRLSKLPIALKQLEETGIGKTVNSLRKYDGEVGDCSNLLVAQWKRRVKDEIIEANETDDSDSEYSDSIPDEVGDYYVQNNQNNIEESDDDRNQPNSINEVSHIKENDEHIILGENNIPCKITNKFIQHDTNNSKLSEHKINKDNKFISTASNSPLVSKRKSESRSIEFNKKFKSEMKVAKEVSNDKRKMFKDTGEQKLEIEANQVTSLPKNKYNLESVCTVIKKENDFKPLDCDLDDAYNSRYSNFKLDVNDENMENYNINEENQDYEISPNQTDEEGDNDEEDENEDEDEDESDDNDDGEKCANVENNCYSEAFITKDCHIKKEPSVEKPQVKVNIEKENHIPDHKHYRSSSSSHHKDSHKGDKDSHSKTNHHDSDKSVNKTHKERSHSRQPENYTNSIKHKDDKKLSSSDKHHRSDSHKHRSSSHHKDHRSSNEKKDKSSSDKQYSSYHHKSLHNSHHRKEHKSPSKDKYVTKQQNKTIKENPVYTEKRDHKIFTHSSRNPNTIINHENDQSTSNYFNKVENNDKTKKYCEDNKKSKIDIDGGGFGAALLEISSKVVVSPKKKSTVKPHSNSNSPSTSTKSVVEADTLSDDIHVVPFEVAISDDECDYHSKLQHTTTDKRYNTQSEEDALISIMTTKNQKTKVFSGSKSKTVNKIDSLFELCTRILQENIECLEYTGGVPYMVIKPILQRITAEQLALFEKHNTYVHEETDELWEFHIKKHFRSAERQDGESWRDLYQRCSNEMEEKLQSLKDNINLSIANSVPVRKTKMAYLNNYVKPPRNIAKKQSTNGISADIKVIKRPSNEPQPSASSIQSIKEKLTAKFSDPMPPIKNQLLLKKKPAPLMQKALQLMKGSRFRR